MSKIIITSNNTTQALADRLNTALEVRFDKNVVLELKDVFTSDDDIEAKIERTINETSALLILIGDDWLADGWGDNDDHPLHLAIRYAIEYKVAIIPILVENASMPTVKELPLAYVQLFLNRMPLKLRGASFETDSHKIIREVTDSIAPTPLPTSIQIKNAYLSHQENPSAPHILQVDLANRWRRLFAHLLDVVFLYGFVFILATLVVNSREIRTIAEYNALVNTFTWIIYALVSAYYIVSWATGGQTFGKIIMKIRIIKTDGRRLNWLDSIIRYSLQGIFAIFFLLDIRFLSGIMAFIIFFGYVSILFDERRQGWHDKIAKTLVIKVD